MAGEPGLPGSLATAGAPLPTRCRAHLFSGGMESVSKREYSRRAELQRLLGTLGTVQPRQAHGTLERPAQGWYALLADGTLVFLGDYAALAMVAIARLVEGVPA